MIVEEILDKGNYTTPEPFMNLSMSIKYVQSAYLKARTDGVPEEKLEMLRRFMNEANVMMQSAMPQPPAEAVQTGQPAPAPQAELLANAPVPPPTMA